MSEKTIFFTSSVERRAKEELQGPKADQVHQDMKVWLVQWVLEDWRENQASLDHQVPEVYL